MPAERLGTRRFAQFRSVLVELNGSSGRRPSTLFRWASSAIFWTRAPARRSTCTRNTSTRR